MDLYILLASGVLGAVFLSSQDGIRQNGASFAPVLLKTLVGAFGGAMVYLLMLNAGRFPLDVNIGSFLLLFVLGGFGGAISTFALASLRLALNKRKN